MSAPPTTVYPGMESRLVGARPGIWVRTAAVAPGDATASTPCGVTAAIVPSAATSGAHRPGGDPLPLRSSPANALTWVVTPVAALTTITDSSPVKMKNDPPLATGAEAPSPTSTDHSRRPSSLRTA